jgi:hypothetical protein
MENVGQKSQKYTLGVRIGPSMTIGHFPKNLPDTVLKSHKNKAKFGFTAVGQLGFPLQKDYTCLIEAGYSRAGRKVEYNKGDWQNDFTYNYITTSLALRRAFQFKLKNGAYADWFLNVGPNIAYMAGAKGAIRVHVPKQGEPWNTPAKTTVRPFDVEFHTLSDSGWYKKNYNEIGVYHFNNANRFFFGVDIGAGAFAPITARQRVYVELRLTLGQTFIRKRDTKAVLGGTLGGITDPANPDPNPGVYGQFSDPLTTNMKTIALTVAYTFNFDKKEAKKGKSTLDKSRKSPNRRK